MKDLCHILLSYDYINLIDTCTISHIDHIETAYLAMLKNVNIKQVSVDLKIGNINEQSIDVYDNENDPFD